MLLLTFLSSLLLPHPRSRDAASRDAAEAVFHPQLIRLARIELRMVAAKDWSDRVTL
jgi:hypothetical protein